MVLSIPIIFTVSSEVEIHVYTVVNEDAQNAWEAFPTFVVVSYMLSLIGALNYE